MFIIHRYVTNNAGQAYFTIEVNWREAYLTLWDSHNTPTLWWLPQHRDTTFILPLKKIVGKLVNYSLLLEEKRSLKIYY